MFLGIEKRRTTACNPKCNGLVERMHGTMKQILATKATQYNDWEAIVPIAQYVLNTAINDHGVSPAMCMFGEQVPMPNVMFNNPPTGRLYKDETCTSYLMSLAHNLRNLRKYLLKMDVTIMPRVGNQTELKQKFSMVYVRIEPRLPALHLFWKYARK